MSMNTYDQKIEHIVKTRATKIGGDDPDDSST